MPRGGHFGLWKPQKDFFKSRWKRFYKRCYRKRNTAGNGPDRAGPHEQPRHTPDGVPSPWKLMYSVDNFKGLPPPTDARSTTNEYIHNLRRFLRPFSECRQPRGTQAVLRALDPGRHGTDSGNGRLETIPLTTDRWKAGPEHMPQHILNLMNPKGRSSASEETEDTSFLMKVVGVTEDRRAQGTFPVRRLYELVEEHEIVWKDGLNKVGASSAKARKDGKDKDGAELEEVKDRGRFPFIDEQASLIDELGLQEILKHRHRINSRRHPKWREIQYENKKGQKSYLRRRQMGLDEAKARMGVIRQTLADS